MSVTAPADRDRTAGRIGILVPASNTNLEPDAALLHPPEVTVHFARIGSYDEDAIPNADAMRVFADEPLDLAISQLTAASVDIIAYGCTSATLANLPAYDRDLAGRVRRLGRVPCVTAAGAVVCALRALRATRIALISPYVQGLREAGASFLAAEGVEVVSNVGPDRDLTSAEQGRLTLADTMRLVERSAAARADAVVISCTDLRAAEIIPGLEARTGRPVVTSNQALLWAAVGGIGVETESVTALGRLRVCPPPPASLPQAVAVGGPVGGNPAAG
jgi:maleate isomerase